jgi:nicotinamidase/pyrazinamidase
MRYNLIFDGIGAEHDSVRVANMIRNHIDEIDEIFMTMDTHHRNHIAHPTFWSSTIDGVGGIEPSHFTQIYSHQVNKIWFPKDPSLRVSEFMFHVHFEMNLQLEVSLWK